MRARILIRVPFSLQADTDPYGGSEYPALAVNGGTDDFSLCTAANGQDTIVYQAAENNAAGYDFQTCSSVRVQLVGLD